MRRRVARVRGQNDAEVEAALRQQLAPGVRFTSIAVIAEGDSSRAAGRSGRTNRQRQLGLQCFFADGSASDWFTVGCTMPMLRRAVAVVQPSPRVRVRALEELAGDADAVEGVRAASPRTVAALPNGRLGADGAARLAAKGTDACPLCLESFGAADVVVCMPCQGAHIAHMTCMRPWLGVASTCPTCRFALPHGSSDRSLAALVAPARAELRQLMRNGPAGPVAASSSGQQAARTEACTHTGAAEAAAAATAAALAAAAAAPEARGRRRAQPSDEERELAELRVLLRSGRSSPRQQQQVGSCTVAAPAPRKASGSSVVLGDAGLSVT